MWQANAVDDVIDIGADCVVRIEKLHLTAIRIMARGTARLHDRRDVMGVGDAFCRLHFLAFRGAPCRRTELEHQGSANNETKSEDVLHVIQICGQDRSFEEMGELAAGDVFVNFLTFAFVKRAPGEDFWTVEYPIAVSWYQT